MACFLHLSPKLNPFVKLDGAVTILVNRTEQFLRIQLSEVRFPAKQQVYQYFRVSSLSIVLELLVSILLNMALRRPSRSGDSLIVSGSLPLLSNFPSQSTVFGIIICTTSVEVLFKVLLQVELVKHVLVLCQAVLVVDQVQVVSQLLSYLMRQRVPSLSIKGLLSGS